MPGVDALALRFGVSPWLRTAHFAAAALGLAAILLTPAAFSWKLCAVLALVFSTAAADVLVAGKSQSGSISLLPDGTAHLLTLAGRQTDARLKENNWITRWFCVLALFEPDRDRRYYCVICASENRPDEYRRLLKFLNMRASTDDLQKAAWY